MITRLGLLAFIIPFVFLHDMGFKGDLARLEVFFEEKLETIKSQVNDITLILETLKPVNESLDEHKTIVTMDQRRIDNIEKLIRQDIDRQIASLPNRTDKIPYVQRCSRDLDRIDEAVTRTRSTVQKCLETIDHSIRVVSKLNEHYLKSQFEINMMYSKLVFCIAYVDLPKAAKYYQGSEGIEGIRARMDKLGFNLRSCTKEFRKQLNDYFSTKEGYEDNIKPEDFKAENLNGECLHKIKIGKLLMTVNPIKDNIIKCLVDFPKENQ